jgi:hypoxanthine phosphoribosyltransferase
MEPLREKTNTTEPSLEELNSPRYLNVVAKTPPWFDERLRALYEEKRDRTKINVASRILDAAFRTAACGLAEVADATGLPKTVIDKRHTWEDIEDLCRVVWHKAVADGFVPDVVIGIKSGGAFVAPFFRELSPDAQVGYIKVQHYSAKSRSVVISAAQMIQEPELTEKPGIPLAGLKVLFIDDQVWTGKTVEVAKRHAQEQGAAEVRCAAFYVKNPNQIDYWAEQGQALYFPWGKDA